MCKLELVVDLIQMPEREQIDEENSRKNIARTSQKIEIYGKIEELKLQAVRASMIGNYDDAIKNAEKIIRIAISEDLPEYIKEQQSFLNDIAEKVQKDYTIEEIHTVGKGIRKIYEIMIDGEKYQEAHNILDDFKKNYKHISYFNSIPLIQELLSRDDKLWISYQSTLSEEEEKTEEETEKSDFQKELKEIKDFLNRM